MIEVKRYVFDSLLGMMVQNADGEYRRNSDYEAIERENAQYKKWLVRKDCSQCHGSGYFPDSNEGVDCGDKTYQPSAASDGYTPCSKCGGRTILANGLAGEFTPDSEPFESGVEEETDFEEITLDTPIYVHMKWCPECRRIEEKWFA